MTTVEYINFIKGKTARQILNDCGEDYSKAGFYYEALWDLCIKFGVSPYGKVKPYKGNINTGSIYEIRDIRTILNDNAISGNSSGYSDITFTKENKFYISSSKYFQGNTGKSLSDFDIDKLISIRSQNHILTNAKIILFTRDKNEWEKIKLAANSSSDHIKTQVSEVFDLDDLEKCLKELNSLFVKYDYNFDRLNNEYYQVDRTLMKLKFHQQLNIDKTMDGINNGEKEFLWGWICRSGKTYGCAGVINELKKAKGSVKALIITPAVYTIPQFTETFEKHIEFNNYTIVDIGHPKSNNIIKTAKDDLIVLSSKQYLQDREKEKIQILNDIVFDIIIFDETHLGGSTDISKEIVYSYTTTNNTVKLFLTATYNKPLSSWSIADRNCFFWDIEDIRLCKRKRIQSLKRKHGKKVEEYLSSNLFAIDDIVETYKNEPDIVFMSFFFNEQFKSDLAGYIDDTFGFNMLKLFSYYNGAFNNSQDIQNLIKHIGGGVPAGSIKKNSIYERIKRSSVRYKSRTLTGEFTSSLWFLPYGVNTKIDDIQKLLTPFLNRDLVFKNYDVLSINSNIYEPYELKRVIKEAERKAKDNGKSGLIILTGGQCEVGITLDLVDVVILLNNFSSADKIYQQSFRCMSTGENKKVGYVVDMNPGRTLSCNIEYARQIFKYESDPQQMITLISDLITFDIDMVDEMRISKENLCKTLYQLWLKHEKDPYKLFNKFDLKAFYDENSISDEDKNYLKELRLKPYRVIKPLTPINDTSLIERGKTYESQPLPESEIKKTLLPELTLADILQFTIPMASLLCNFNDNNIISVFENIRKNTREDVNPSDMFEEFCFYKFTKDASNIPFVNNCEFIDFIIGSIRKYVDIKGINERLAIFNTEIKNKCTEVSPEFIEYIAKYINPSEAEKKLFGEVFTPMALVNEMLDKLPKEVWGNPKLKWLDNSVGIGNFPVAICIRLMEGLKKAIPDFHTRKKHIIENMLYMVDISPKNLMLLKQTFYNPKAKIHQGNYLEMDLKEIWGVDKFDVIVANPPFQSVDDKGNIKKGGEHPLYIKFIEKSLQDLKKNAFLLFLTPPSFMTPKNTILYDFLNRNLLYLNLNHASKYFPSISNKFSWYVLQNNKKYNETEVSCFYKGKTYDSSIKIKKETLCLPVLLNKESYSLFNKMLTHKGKMVVHVDYKYDPRREYMSKTQSDEFCYPYKHTGDQIVFSSLQHPAQYKKKVTLSNSGYTNPYYDPGHYGVTQGCTYILVDSDEEGDTLCNLLNSKLYQFFFEIAKWSGFNNPTLLRNIPLPKAKLSSDKEIYTYFNLSSDEIKLIESIV